MECIVYDILDDHTGKNQLTFFFDDFTVSPPLCCLDRAAHGCRGLLYAHVMYNVKKLLSRVMRRRHIPRQPYWTLS